MEKTTQTLSHNDKKIIYITLSILIILIAIWLLVYRLYPKKVTEVETPKTPLEVLNDLQNQSQPVTSTPVERGNTLDSLEKSSKKVKIDQDAKLKILESLSNK